MVKGLGARGAFSHWFLLRVVGWGELVPRQRGRGAGQAGTTPQPLAASVPDTLTGLQSLQAASNGEERHSSRPPS